MGPAFGPSSSLACLQILHGRGDSYHRGWAFPKCFELNGWMLLSFPPYHIGLDQRPDSSTRGSRGRTKEELLLIFAAALAQHRPQHEHGDDGDDGVFQSTATRSPIRSGLSPVPPCGPSLQSRTRRTRTALPWSPVSAVTHIHFSAECLTATVAPGTSARGSSLRSFLRYGYVLGILGCHPRPCAQSDRLRRRQGVVFSVSVLGVTSQDDKGWAMTMALRMPGRRALGGSRIPLRMARCLLFCGGFRSLWGRAR